jgi:hypothetical protein
MMELNQQTIDKRLLSRITYVCIASILVILAMVGMWAIKPSKTRVILGGSEISVEVANTPDLRTRGLSGHVRHDVNEGMLFIFNDAEQYSFWMKDMSFPIDIVWFDSQYRVVYVKKNAEPTSYPEVFTPTAPAQYVLEVPAGFFSSHNLKVGDELKISR